MAPSGEPKESPKPQPIGNFPMVVLVLLCTLCALFLLYRQANSIRRVVGHRLQTWTSSEGRIRLSEDDGPSSHSFVGDGDDDDADDEPLALRVERLRGPNSPPSSSGGTSRVAQTPKRSNNKTSVQKTGDEENGRELTLIS